MEMAIKRSEGPSTESSNQYFEARDFSELYDEYFDRVNRYLRCRVRNSWDADDLTTTVFLKALEKFEQYSRTSPFASWIFRIAHNTYVDFMRKNREVPVDQEMFVGAEADETWQPERLTLLNEDIRMLRDRLELLTQDQRDVLTLRYFADLKISQVAEVLGKTESSVKMISYRALHQLQRMYERGDNQ
ncbi:MULTISPECIES: RNA polymerase sigma factor [Brevibacillus]|jgi:RNA polymerase sigma-70 factor (ECF subfamily)|uniref:RNA polymerase ECF-type sigma factor n=1 Tax=Brevibacillus borstelensis AK1 TaxID=1300222 RepID=M8DCI5_9BACL|nr:sigma-70 family RNA polymerase sigma factor [Brevibacillus borstelensis]EMT54019.1 RNA polymerase ECF-type sigma factor [Brevibacillus borstelensis AK1]KKX53859.1 RNA polymerase subunit sigma-24 [Brevibacillus borstelensis cifa_chp40]MBE5396488.1 sigma-70 family RNA polymerase sigma factor [Brevibacillus borstelensis]MCC0563728.1 sigma-70 family RNA polymerase sigma factor [Brevibacillus borstelensis]MCM3469573.1 sigma-70 family RNA polymerase sigma factor [Brevibacillus borstelensis]